MSLPPPNKQATPNFRVIFPLVAISIATAAFVHTLPLGTSSPLLVELRNSLHAPVFAIFTSIILLSFIRTFSVASAMWISTFVAVAAAILGELVQIFFNGNASFSDLLSDAGGIVLGLTYGAVFIARNNAAKNRRAEKTLMALAFLGTIIVAAPVTTAARPIIHQNLAFPKILTFEHAWEAKTYSTYRGAVAQMGPAPVAWDNENGNVAHIDFAATSYSGFEIHPYADWSNYDFLVFTASSGNDREYELSIRIDDVGHNGNFRDRFHRKLVLTPNKQEYRVRLSDVRSAPDDRDMDISRIRAVLFFVGNPNGSESAILDDIHLSILHGQENLAIRTTTKKANKIPLLMGSFIAKTTGS